VTATGDGPGLQITQTYIRSSYCAVEFAVVPAQPVPPLSGALTRTWASKLEVLTPPPSAFLPLEQRTVALFR
jgi:hypothetical protein